MKIERNITILSLFNFCTDFIFFTPIAILYFAQVTGSFSLGMSIFSLVYVSSAFFEVPTGVVSDLVGRRKTMILGALCAVSYVVMYAIGGSFWILALGSLFQGLSRAFYSGNNDALLHDTLSDMGKADDYHSYLGRTSSMFQWALAIAAIIGGFMAAQSYALVMWASVIPQIGALIFAILIIEPNVQSNESTNILEHLKEAIRQFRTNYKLRLLNIASVLRFSLGESSYTLRSAFVASVWPLWAIGIANALSNIGAAITYYNSGKIINKFKSLKLLQFEIIFNRIVNLIALIFPTVVSPVLMSTSSLAYGVGSISMNSLLQKEFTQKQRATMGSLNSFVGNLAFGVFSIVLGAIADMFNTRVALIVSHSILILPLFIYRMIFKHEVALSTK